ncbi:low molecular weight protein arginine phosphatase [uncultured Ruminococcus sp.]|uniref:arsenate reductase/protein-tyrosine-phosphatase family protein n=1 Tax=uncultured Ruminococcus sp. TaxID=165186 RepID=UPI00292D331C|nr:low molecular weight protein arginine phosphatase [uncultured Ruminococcus sp.]
MKKLLFVCTGNTCRSPMAEVIFNSLAVQQGLDWRAESAGVAAVGEQPASPNAIRAVAEIGLDLNMHRTRFLPAVDLNEYSLFVALGEEHADILRSIGIPADYVRVLHRAPNADDIYDLRMDIADPYGGDLNDYRKCRDDIVGAVKALMTTLS